MIHFYSDLWAIRVLNVLEDIMTQMGGGRVVKRDEMIAKSQFFISILLPNEIFGVMLTATNIKKGIIKRQMTIQ